MDYINIFISIINLGILQKKLYVIVRKSKLLISLCICLYNNGYISSFLINKETIFIYLKYKDGKAVFFKFIRISKRSKKIYMSVKEIKKYSVCVVSTINGFQLYNNITLNEKKISGELLFVII